ncbi:MAG TPA: dinitrogenase iron-molybdenum cofactor [bacterium]|nr:dinitrogenase iron-molybdenum cofactor [bacterium]
MKIAISTDSGNVSPHFGRCPEFTIVEIENNQIGEKKLIPNPGHEPGFLPRFLSELGVEVIIAGGAGQRAQMLFTEKNIQMILGIVGSVDENLDLLCQGKLAGGESLCSSGGHDHGGRDCHHHSN